MLGKLLNRGVAVGFLAYRNNVVILRRTQDGAKKYFKAIKSSDDSHY
jgi:hypothetical protein